MPTYDYECKKCGYAFVEYQSMGEDKLTTCPEPGCGGDLIRLVGRGAGIKFKGAGFHNNDYDNSGPRSVPRSTRTKD
jgi:putative FmdB family regulatory protein